MLAARETCYDLHCRNCGQTGFLSITSSGYRDWSFATVGFDGLAVNRSNPRNSVFRCYGCGSGIVTVAARS